MKAILSIASTTIGEAIRRRVLLIILMVGLLFLAIGPALGTLSQRQETTVLIGFMLGNIQITSAVIALVLTVYLIPNEIERRTIYVILSKPVQRWQFLFGKYLGAVGALALMMALMTVVQVIVFTMQIGWNPERAMELTKVPVMYFVQMSLLAAVAIFFSTFVSPMVNFFLSGGVYMVGSLLNPLVETLANNPSIPGPAKAGVQVLSLLIPNFANYSVQNPIINATQNIGNETTYYLSNVAYGLFYIGILLVGGILIFDRREV